MGKRYEAEEEKETVGQAVQGIQEEKEGNPETQKQTPASVSETLELPEEVKEAVTGSGSF